MNLDLIRHSQLEDKYCNKLPDYKQLHGMFDFSSRVIMIDYNDFIWLMDKVKELSNTTIQKAEVPARPQ